MRDSLKRSLADSPAKGFERYPKGSTILCNACGLPIFRLDEAISFGEGMGRAARAFKPLTLLQLNVFSAREDIDAGVRARLAAMTSAERRAHVEKLREIRTGDPALCPACNDCFVQVLAVEQHEVLDRAYTVELLAVPPAGAGAPPPVRGKRLGTGKDWVH